MVRFAKKEELEQVNALRKQVNDIHVAGRPDIFKPGFNEELKNFIFEVWNDAAKGIVVAEEEDRIVGFAIINAIDKPENPFMFARRYLDIDEFCVDENDRRKGVATQLIAFVKQYAQKEGFDKLELNMWEFNTDALAFYEAVGFRTYRRYLDMNL